MSVVDYLRPVEFRSPPRYDILVPYLLLFFGVILLMGLPVFTLSRPLWLVTVVTTVFLLGAMGTAMRAGVGSARGPPVRSATHTRAARSTRDGTSAGRPPYSGLSGSGDPLPRR